MSYFEFQKLPFQISFSFCTPLTRGLFIHLIHHFAVIVCSFSNNGATNSFVNNERRCLLETASITHKILIEFSHAIKHTSKVNHSNWMTQNYNMLQIGFALWTFSFPLTLNLHLVDSLSLRSIRMPIWSVHQPLKINDKSIIQWSHTCQTIHEWHEK